MNEITTTRNLTRLDLYTPAEINRALEKAGVTPLIFAELPAEILPQNRFPKGRTIPYQEAVEVWNQLGAVILSTHDFNIGNCPLKAELRSRPMIWGQELGNFILTIVLTLLVIGCFTLALLDFLKTHYPKLRPKDNTLSQNRPLDYSAKGVFPRAHLTELTK